MFRCEHCGAVQAPVDDAWRKQVERIYRAYNTYAAAGGKEQKVMASGSGAPDSRSRVLVEWLRSLRLLPEQGELLDVGCGRGSFLEAFGSLFPDWGLHGTEFDDKNAAVLAAIPRFKGLQTGRFEEIEGSYSLVSMLHVLEHIENPVQCLATLREKGSDNALLLVQVPDWSSNPFALAIADHATHFTPEILASVARAAGWEPVAPVTQVVPKELTLLARASAVAMQGVFASPGDSASLLTSRLAWLENVRKQAVATASESNAFGIFGTAVAGTWLAGSCNGKTQFFVDEDTNRIGSTHLGLPIMSPADVPRGADVFVGLAPVVAERLAQKYADGPAHFHGVPPLPQ
ncbi:MAG: class I SAM-dependent methyltransferase [Chthoniobacterales bacterium]|nr:class I SAM-dependent methyltransferase [Chthoniobacterales bacterium]